MDYILLILGAVLVNNFVLARLLGIGPLLVASTNIGIGPRHRQVCTRRATRMSSGMDHDHIRFI